MENYITVNIADYKVAKGTQKLITRNLGSCVAVAIRDPEKKVGGLLHIMLPYSTADAEENVYPKYADRGIPLMVSKLYQMGADQKKLVAKLAGAAHIIKTEGVPEELDMSSRNLKAVREKLTEMSIPILAQEVEDYIPRTVIFEPETGELLIKTMGKQDKKI